MLIAPVLNTKQHPDLTPSACHNAVLKHCRLMLSCTRAPRAVPNWISEYTQIYVHIYFRMYPSYSPPPPPPWDTQWAQIRQQGPEPPRMHKIGRIPTVPEREREREREMYTYIYIIYYTPLPLNLPNIYISRGHSERPTRWGLALFAGFPNFWSVAPNFRSVVVGGVCVYFLKSVRKCRFRNVWVGGGGKVVTFLSTELKLE